ncbi:MAG: hypothetical protein HXS52_11510 [Theionarchaea archaeon]|nr:hypothetical protein [Theionarchaea archaeon]MBU7038548.1 hypothetical protein [Theionarchaea archaeon]
MNCYYHPDRTSVAQCFTCAKNLCSDCVVMKEGRTYCKECLGTGESSIEMQQILIPGLIGGVVGGILSVAPVISILNCVLCLWIVVGGALAVYIAKRWSNIKGKISTGKAALTGAISGCVAAIIIVVIQFFSVGDFRSLLQEAAYTPEVRDALREAGITLEEIAGTLIVLTVLIMVVVLALFGALGGIISNEIKK